MRRAFVVAGLVLVLCGAAPSHAEAGVGDVFKNTFTYVKDFVLCLTVDLGGKAVNLIVETSTCALARANRNPATLRPIVTAPIVVPSLPSP